ncbi:hypothetical protein HQ325_04905 [Rhodococcus sp. BP-349]|uniref:hypothetical protein n=1 Tax=unclassified Rhodococcus (in: high G+C Gram-positive bacteria) TaxID=192944 RepID=UPI001C9B416D|nr:MULTISPECIES: hypothetical protein [unclassified Rhodococcus (in: high G+C Gram-positive bacteria)]MBY6538005.1 hypothetical protein [Rhodococcus sp. BP-363]MBY6542342.1 hypothetical protein [Rhodococcus sp. BP-369]MBY6561572.1 hypothetical protein [Rhodococcus sp. BP-370]MBY6575864.1 hypothetical protein [Rhodococcus sp. BP-364]MBY6585165.1 hypothetical protein [Rhodococcus sp. BP-358]
MVSAGYRRDGRGTSVITDIVDVCVELTGADGAALVLVAPDGGPAQTVAHVTDETAARVARALHTLGTGPAIDALADGAVHDAAVEDSLDRLRWPQVTGELGLLGVGWLRVFPVGPRARPSGTLQLHRRTWRGRGWSTDLDAPLGRLAHSLATLSATEFADENAAAAGPDTDVVHTAIGMIAARQKIPVPAASALLRAVADSHGRASVAQARIIVESLGRRGTDR